jgi:hypothetical protein|tara:strand:+ start:803 stop:1057 length:255 start_codon:yes stop_codon:yes gene_type:complete
MFAMSNTNTQSQTRRVLNYLTSGRGLTSAEARSRFGVQNMRAVMTRVRQLTERYGNWRVTTSETTTGSTRYMIKKVILVDPVSA